MSEKLDPRIAKALDAAKAGWDEVEAAPSYRELVAGEYVCRFEHAKSRLWIAETKQIGFKVCFTVVEGEFIDRRLYLDLWPNAEDEMAVRMAKRDLGLLGLTLSDLPNPPAVEGRFMVVVRGEEGKTKVQKFEVAA